AAEKCLDSLGKIFQRADATAREQFQASLLQLQAAHSGDLEADTKNQNDVWERLTKLAQSDDTVGLDSLVLLAQRQLSSGVKSEIRRNAAGGETWPSNPKSEMEELVRQLNSHPLAKAPQKLLAIDLQIQA